MRALLVLAWVLGLPAFWFTALYVSYLLRRQVARLREPVYAPVADLELWMDEHRVSGN